MRPTLFLWLFLLAGTHAQPPAERADQIPEAKDHWATCDHCVGAYGDERLSLHAAVEEAKSGALPVVRLTVENLGPRDTMLILGTMQDGGGIQIPEVDLVVATEAGKTRYRYTDREHLNVGGNLDDYLVPLAVGSTYSFPIDLARFYVAAVPWPSKKLAPPTKPCRVVFVLEGGSGLEKRSSRLRVWKGELRSNELALGPSTGSPGEPR